MSFFDVFPTFSEAWLPYLMVLVLLISSILGFYRKSYFYALLLHPYEVYRGKRLHTVLTSAFVHRNWWHLLFNLIVIYSLGFDMSSSIEQELGTRMAYFLPPLFFVLMVVIPNFLQVRIKKEHFIFTAVGSSGLSFGLAGFSLFIYPLEKVSHRLFPFVQNSGQYWLYFLLIIVLLSFIRQMKINRSLHLIGYILGSIFALLIRPASILQLFKAFSNVF